MKVQLKWWHFPGCHRLVTMFGLIEVKWLIAKRLTCLCRLIYTVQFARSGPNVNNYQWRLVEWMLQMSWERS